MIHHHRLSWFRQFRMLWSTRPEQYSGVHGKVLGLSRLCWCGTHWGGYMTLVTMESHNRVAREMVERINVHT